MNVKGFFVDALTNALDLGIGSPEDVLRHVSADALAQHLPRPLWARLLTACLGAPRVDAQLVVETIGVPNLCEHLPAQMIWACIADIGARAIGKAAEDIVPLVTPKAVAPTPVAVTTTPVRAFTPPSGVARTPLTPPPPDAAPTPVRASASSPVPAGPAIPSPANQPLSDLIDDLEQETPVPTPVPAAARARTPSSQRFRQSNTGIGRPIASSGARRPQAQASPVSIPAARNNPTARRGSTEADEAETAAEADWRSREPIAVDDSQLVDWQTETTAATDDDFGRKR